MHIRPLIGLTTDNEGLIMDLTRPLTEPRPGKCQFDAVENTVVLCQDMANQLSKANAGDVFSMSYIDGSPAIICDYDKSVLFYCPFCGSKIRERPNLKNEWRCIEEHEFKTYSINRDQDE